MTAILVFGIFIWAYWVIESHPKHSIVSWDEGFHGGSALFVSEGLRNNFHFLDFTYILNDFKNGIIWYPPLWLIVAGLLGVILEPSVELYRFATLIFAMASLFLIAMFIRSIAGWRVAFIAVTTLAFVPTFIIYSHLMMREVPLLFATSFTLLTFCRFLTKNRITKFDLILTLIAFSLGVLAKVIGIILIFGTILSFGLLLYLFYKNTDLWKRFFSKWTFIFLLFSVISFFAFRNFNIEVLNADPLNFFIGQTKELEGNQNNIFLVMVRIFLQNCTYYLTDFSHMLPLTVIWFGSLISYVIMKRSPLSYFLLIWTFITYIVFSAVKPQAHQYILSIFAPISLSVGLFWGEFIKYRNKIIANTFLIFLLILTVFLQDIYFTRTASIVWRNTITSQDMAVKYVVENAKWGDRVLSSGDGTRFLLRLFGFKKKLQTINGASPNCETSIRDSTEWAISDFGPQNPLRVNVIKESNWIKVTSFYGEIEEIEVYRNANNTRKVIDVRDNLVKDRCVRFLLHGKNEITVFATPEIKKDKPAVQSDLMIKLRPNILKSVGEFKVSQEDLRAQNGMEQKYSFIFEQTKVNQPIFISYDIPENINLYVRRIEINNLE